MNKLDYYKYNIMQGNTKSEAKLCCKKKQEFLRENCCPKTEVEINS